MHTDYFVQPLAAATGTRPLVVTVTASPASRYWWQSPIIDAHILPGRRI